MLIDVLGEKRVRNTVVLEKMGAEVGGVQMRSEFFGFCALQWGQERIDCSDGSVVLYEGRMSSFIQGVFIGYQGEYVIYRNIYSVKLFKKWLGGCLLYFSLWQQKVKSNVNMVNQGIGKISYVILIY